MDLSEPGTGVTSAFVDYMIKETQSIHVKANSTHLPSMLLDAESGRPMELEVIVGEVVRMAKAANVSVPVSVMALTGWCMLTDDLCLSGSK